ncbi:MAG: hypothetical protein OSJ70_07480 [Bacilli bacterium]|nr:hypothetical protein [Bacilli bacterium]
MKKYKDMFIIGSFLVVIILGCILLGMRQTKRDSLTIIKEDLKKTNRIVVAIGEQKQIKDDNKKFIYDYHENKYEIVKEITDEKEVKSILNIVNNMKYVSDDAVGLDYLSARLFQFYHNNKKLAEYNLQQITIGYNTNIPISLEKEELNNLDKYFVEYYKLR